MVGNVLGLSALDGSDGFFLTMCVVGISFTGGGFLDIGEWSCSSTSSSMRFGVDFGGEVQECRLCRLFAEWVFVVLRF